MKKIRYNSFEVLPAREMRERYKLTAENRPTIRLDPAHVPLCLRGLIPLAERYGISDDLIREDVLRNTSEAELEEMRRVVKAADDGLDEWLAGPASEGPVFSEEYIAFSCLRLAADGC